MGSEARARLGLAGLLVATLFCFGLVFVGSAYSGPALIGIALSWAISLGARRLGLGVIPTALVSLLALVWFVVLLFFPETTFYGLPTAGSVEAAGRAATRAYQSSLVDYAPVPLRPGYILLVVAGLWLTAALGEVATFRWRRPLVASLLPLTIFVLTGVLGVERGAGWIMLLFLGALVAYWGLESSNRLRAWGRWVPTWTSHDDSEPPAVMGRMARRMGASCLAAALFAPLLLPALEEGLLAWRRGTGGQGGIGAGVGAIDPLVSIVPELLAQSDEELFIVEAERASYWRTQSLVEFDGENWHPLQGDQAATVDRGDIQNFFETNDWEGRDLVQAVEVTGLKGTYLPAATSPRLISFDGGSGRGEGDLHVTLESNELLLDGGVVAGMEYEVTSEEPVASYADLLTAQPAAHLPPEYYELPQGVHNLPQEVHDLLRGWTQGAPRPFEKLLAIQEQLQGFTYNEQVEPQATSDHLTYFLLRGREGYCQQFATSFALLARALNFPARVSVGFLPGEQSPAENVFTVRGTDAHAWPEVFFEDIGWVRFEPTPRDEAAPPRYTVPSVTAPTTAGGRGLDARKKRGNIYDVGAVQGGRRSPRLDELQRGRRTPEDTAWQQRSRRVAVVLLALLLVALVSVPVLKLVIARLRYRRATTPVRLAAAAFLDFAERAGALVVPRRAAESATSYALRIAGVKQLPERDAARLAVIYEAAQYSQRGISASDAEEARRLAGALKAMLWKRARWWNRIDAVFSPDGLLPERAPLRARRPLLSGP